VVPCGSDKQCTLQTEPISLQGLSLTFRHAIRLLSKHLPYPTTFTQLRPDPFQPIKWPILDAIHLQPAPRLRMSGVTSPVTTCLYSMHSTGVLISPWPDLLLDVFCLMVRMFRLMIVLLYI